MRRPFPFVKQQVQVRTYCVKTKRSGFDPHTGCGECHPLPREFAEAKIFLDGEAEDEENT